jgi:hypothetical protein
MSLATTSFSEPRSPEKGGIMSRSFQLFLFTLCSSFAMAAGASAATEITPYGNPGGVVVNCRFELEKGGECRAYVLYDKDQDHRNRFAVKCNGADVYDGGFTYDNKHGYDIVKATSCDTALVFKTPKQVPDQDLDAILYLSDDTRVQGQCDVENQ